MKTDGLKKKLMETARGIEPDRRIPAALETRVMAHITSASKYTEDNDVKMWGWKPICLWGGLSSVLTSLLLLGLVSVTAKNCPIQDSPVLTTLTMGSQISQFNPESPN